MASAYEFNVILWCGIGLCALAFGLILYRCVHDDTCFCGRTWAICLLAISGLVTVSYGIAGLLAVTEMGDFLRDGNATRFERFVLDAANVVVATPMK